LLGRRTPIHTPDAADTRRQFGAEEPSVGRLVRDAADGGQPKVDRGRRMSALFEVNPISEHDGAVEREAGAPNSTTQRTGEWRGRTSAGRWRRSGCSGRPFWLVPDRAGPERVWAASSCGISTSASADGLLHRRRQLHGPSPLPRLWGLIVLTDRTRAALIETDAVLRNDCAFPRNERSPSGSRKSHR
jgi:hypothetical protein